jgi:hypothetical protein
MILTESAGVGRTLLESEESKLFSRLGFSLRHRIREDVLSIEPESTDVNTTTYGGLEWVTDYSQTMASENMKLVSKLRVFQALFNSESDALVGTEEEDYWKAPDVAWENTLSAAISKYIQVSLFAELLYDKEVDLRGQFREILGLGVTYKLF